MDGMAYRPGGRKMSCRKERLMADRVFVPGESAGDYTADWRKTFDLVFLLGWLLAAVVLGIVTLASEPEFFQDYRFLALAGLKLALMLLMSLAGGIVCRHFCAVDAKGYIVTSKASWFKVNYTRKLQHFAAYLVPLINLGGPKQHVQGIIPHLWEALFVLLIFLLLIKPIRERSKFFMLQFNSLDRPEDRPHTLKWIILGNILPGLVLGLFFRELYEAMGFANLALIIVFIIGIGDGLAEPVGIYLGRHKYRVPAWFSSRTYLRSVEGSACVFLSSVVIIACFFEEFHSLREFLAAQGVVPITMTVVEATAPHSMDTPALMLVGFSVLYAIILIF
jgi:dolichol kinase